MALKTNIVANFVGRGWQVLLSLAVVPVYLKIMGPESYGLIGFFVSLQALLALLDLGLGGALCRELARSSDDQQAEYQARDIVRTLEIVYWCVGIFASALLLGLSQFIANYWLKADQLDAVALQRVLAYMVMAIALQWPSSLYNSGLIGLQRQVLVNIVGIATSTVRMVGSVLVIWLIAPTVEAFFLWQIVAATFQTSFSRWLLWYCMPVATGRNGPQFSKRILRHIWKFAGSLSATSLMFALLGQVDKLMLSAILPLRVFGYYMLANTVAQSINMVPAPITDAMYPRYAQLVAQNNNADLVRLFHKSCQFVVGLVFPLAAVLACFSDEILLLWTRDREVVQATWKLATVLIIGVALNSAMSMLDTLQMAFGWMKPAFYSRLVALIAIVPLMWLLCNKYGALGAAIAWLIIFTGYLLVTPFFVFDRILRTEKSTWYKNWMGPFATSFILAALLKYFLRIADSPVLALVEITLVWVSIFTIVAGCSPAYRHSIRTTIRNWQSEKSGQLL